MTKNLSASMCLILALCTAETNAQGLSDSQTKKIVCLAYKGGRIDFIESYSEREMGGVENLYSRLHTYRCAPDGRTPAYDLYVENGPGRFEKVLYPWLERIDRNARYALLNTPASGFRTWTFGEKHTLLDRIESVALWLMRKNDHDSADRHLQLRDKLIAQGARTWAGINSGTSKTSAELEHALANRPGSTRSVSGYRLENSANRVKDIAISGNGEFAFAVDASGLREQDYSYLYRLRLEDKRFETILKLEGEHESDGVNVVPIEVASGRYGRFAAAIMYMDKVVIIDAQEKRVAREIEGEGAHAASLVITPDNKSVIVGYTDCSVYGYELATGERIKEYREKGCPPPPMEPIYPTEWNETPELDVDSASNSLLIGIPYESLRVLDLQSGDVLTEVNISDGPGGVIEGESINIDTLELVDGGRTIAMLPRFYRSVLFIDRRSGDLIDSIPLPGGAFSIDFFESGSHYLVGTERDSLALWDKDQRKVVHRFKADRLLRVEIGIDEGNSRVLSSGRGPYLRNWEIPCDFGLCE